MKVVLKTLDESKAADIQKQLKVWNPNLSFSPCREEQSLVDCLEFLGSGTCTEEEKKALVDHIDNDWDVEDNFYWAYGFNTKMYDPLLYYVEMEFN